MSYSSAGSDHPDEAEQSENRPLAVNRAVTPPPPGLLKKGILPPPGLGIEASPMKVVYRGGPCEGLRKQGGLADRADSLAKLPLFLPLR